MSPLNVVAPAPRLLGRLIVRLRHEGGGSPAFALGGDALAATRLAAVRAPLDEDALALSDAMIGELLLVDAHAADHEDADVRLRLAIATAVIPFARPHMARVTDALVAVWTGVGLGSAQRMHDPTALAARALFAMQRGDLVDAADAAGRLAAVDGEGVAGAVHDWVVARVQGHGTEREAQCFEHLALALGGRHAALLLVAVGTWAAVAGVDRNAAAQVLTDRADSRGFRRVMRRKTGS